MILFSLHYFSIFLLSLITFVKSEKVPYDSFRGVPLTNEEYLEYVRENNTKLCVTQVQTCDPSEWRRIDGTCNNLNYPSRGAANTPYIRFLEADYNTESGSYELRETSEGKPMPWARYLRTSLVPEGRVPDPVFTNMVTYYMVYTIGDVTSIQDTVRLGIEDCCSSDPPDDCRPNAIPFNDPVFRFSSIRCLNMTNPQTYQQFGCVKNDTVPERILKSTSQLDASNLYGTSETIQEFRLFQQGMLRYEVDDDGKYWPPSDNSKNNFCRLNQGPVETRCHKPNPTNSNGILGSNLGFVWFWRNHNKIAGTLSELNPDWDDDLLFYTARDINIAIQMQILYYEMLPSLMGKDNLIRDGVISQGQAFRDPYNANILPQVDLEYTYACRWFHNMQEGQLIMYDVDGNFLRTFPAVNMTTRTGYLALDDNIDYFTQGAFRQACAKSDYIVDPDLSNIGLAGLHQAFDILTNDLAKGRYFGLQPYVAYRQKCFGGSYETFDDLKDVFAPERLEMLQNHYRSVNDIELMAGLWLEGYIEGGYIPETLYCIMATQLKRFVNSDRHWYERQQRPHAFTHDQLQEIRKASMARVLCDVGDGVTKIQPNAFLRYGPGNEIIDCTEIPIIDLSVWQVNVTA